MVPAGTAGNPLNVADAGGASKTLPGSMADSTGASKTLPGSMADSTGASKTLPGIVEERVREHEPTPRYVSGHDGKN